MPEQKRISRSSIRVRRAVGADFNDVMDIDRNIYWGFDYLPALYHAFSHHPDVHMYVAEINNEIVSYIVGKFRTITFYAFESDEMCQELSLA